MVKKTRSHAYTDIKAFERLMLLIATLLKYPGVGYREVDNLENCSNKGHQHHDALTEVQHYLRQLAASLNRELPNRYPATATLRKDLETLRDYQILDRRMYRWGYYLGTGALTPKELQITFNALASQAIYQGDPRMRQIYYQLLQRLRGFKSEPDSDFFYPVRQHLNRAINYTDPQEMMEKGEYRQTLFHQIDKIENAIVQGQAIEISRQTNFYDNQLGCILIWPLQLIYYDIAWYLLYEYCSHGGLAIGRLNRFGNYCKIYTRQGRGIEAQKQSLRQAHQLLERGWGLKLGDVEEQKLELENKLEFIDIKVRFFPPVSYFIEEGELRHPQQKLKRGSKEPLTGKPKYVDYLIQLPPRSLDEFSIWVQRYGDRAQVLSPPELVEKHRQIALALARRYSHAKATIEA
jgi:predicted DNA-binding transcriptional regulator YafY